MLRGTPGRHGLGVGGLSVVGPPGCHVRVGVDDGRRQTRNRNNERLFGGNKGVVRPLHPHHDDLRGSGGAKDGQRDPQGAHAVAGRGQGLINCFASRMLAPTA